MSSIWISDTQDTIYTIVKTRSKKKLINKYADIFYTSDGEAQNETHFPTVFFEFLPSEEIGSDLEGTALNGFNCGCEISVIASKAQGRKACTDVIYEVIDQFKQLGFRVQMSPQFLITGNDTKQITARMERPIGVGDIIK